MALFLEKETARLKCVLLRVLLILSAYAPLVGCAGYRLTRTPQATLSTASGATVTQTGDAQTPAAVTADTTEIEIPVSSFVTGQAVTGRGASQPGTSRRDAAPVTGPGPVTLDPSQCVTPRSSETAGGSLRITTRRESGTAPRAFAPPSPPPPPTAAEQARADVFRWFCVAAIVGLLVAGLLAWSQHYLAAVKVAAGAVALPVLGHFFGSTVAMTVSAALGALGLGLFIAWHRLKPAP